MTIQSQNRENHDGRTGRELFAADDLRLGAGARSCVRQGDRIMPIPEAGNPVVGP